MAHGRASSISEVAEAFRHARRVTAICHENPDADTIGAAVAVSLMADRLGIESEIVSTDHPAPAFDFLPKIAEITPIPRLEPDLAVVCDAATLERVGRIVDDAAEWLSRTRIVNVDHHRSSSFFGELNVVDPEASATCEILARLVAALDIPLDRPLASALLTGIVRDTNGFADPSTSSDTLRLAASLVDAGAPLARIHRTILGDMPYAQMALWARILGTLHRDATGRIIAATLTEQMLAETGTQQHDADGVVEFMARVSDAQVAVLLREIEADQTRVSLRTRDGVDAIEIARRFGGGGHVSRAGCVIPASFDEARRRLVAAAAEVLDAT